MSFVRAVTHSAEHQKALSATMANLVRKWPTDPFRPHLQLKTLLESLSTHPKLTPEAVQATRALSDNVMFDKYKLSKKTLQPAINPKHYDRLLEGFEKSAKGIARPRWKIFFGLW